MTLQLKISHNNPGYPVRALVSVRYADGTPAYGGKEPIGDGEYKTFFVHAGQWLKVTEEGHLEPDYTAAAKRAYAAYCEKVREQGRDGAWLSSWDELSAEHKHCWCAVAEAMA
jgi:hypothetical protein